MIDDVFMDFEEYKNKDEEQLLFGARILELIDVKYKDKLLAWFYNLQLQDLQEILVARLGR